MPTYYAPNGWGAAAGSWTVTGSTGTGATWYPVEPVTGTVASTYTVGNHVTITLTGNITTAMQTIDAVNVFVQQLTAQQMDEYYNGGWARGLPRGEPLLPERTSEEIEEARVRRAAEAERREAAWDRAQGLLFEFLDPVQQDQYEDDGTFQFVGSLGTQYLLTPGTNGNIRWLDDELNEGGRLCAHPRLYDGEGRALPEPDLHLGQFLALTNDELAWLETANVHRGDYPPVFYGHRAPVVTTRPESRQDHAGTELASALEVGALDAA